MGGDDEVLEAGCPPLSRWARLGTLVLVAPRDEAAEWLLRYPADATVMAYLGRSGWNSLTVDGAISRADLREAIDASYSAVVAKLPRRERPGGSPT